jgi:hypothetical protein
MTRVVSALSLLLTLGGIGCTPELGPCDELSALRVAYDEEGTPAFEGQALMIQSCGFGAFCHAAGIDAEQRYGVPRGLDYDVRIANLDADDPGAELDRLEGMLDRSFRHRHEIWAAVESGRMPIGGGPGSDVASAAPTYAVRTGANTLEPMAGLDTARGREALRNWLACGLPAVQSVDAHEARPEALGYIVDPIEVAPLEPSWSSIYDRLISRRCASVPCHGTAVAGDLDLRGARAAYDAMVGVDSAADECIAAGVQLVQPGAADASLLVWKLIGRDPDGAPVCGDLMPVGASRVSEASVDAVRAWIDAGAVYDAPSAE